MRSSSGARPRNLRPARTSKARLSGARANQVSQGVQGVNTQGVEEADMFALDEQAGQFCIEVFFFRNFQNWGNRAYFPKADRTMTPDEFALPLGVLADRLPRSGFAERFGAKGRFAGMMSGIPVKLISMAEPGLYGAAAAFARFLSGSFSGVVGLPLFETAQMLRGFGWPVP